MNTAQTMSVEVPVIDFSRLSTSNSEECLDVESIKTIADQVFSALKETGFLYLKNTGLEKEEVLKSNGIMEQFFLQSKDVKQKFARGSEIHRHHGWMDVSCVFSRAPPSILVAKFFQRVPPLL